MSSNDNRSSKFCDSGMFLICSVVMVVVAAVLVTSTSGASLVTVMVSAIAESSICTSMVGVDPRIIRIPAFSAVANPSSSTVSV